MGLFEKKRYTEKAEEIKISPEEKKLTEIEIAELTTTDASGSEHTFKPGDTVYLIKSNKNSILKIKIAKIKDQTCFVDDNSDFPWRFKDVFYSEAEAQEKLKEIKKEFVDEFKTTDASGQEYVFKSGDVVFFPSRDGKNIFEIEIDCIDSKEKILFEKDSRMDWSFKSVFHNREDAEAKLEEIKKKKEEFKPEELPKKDENNLVDSFTFEIGSFFAPKHLEVGKDVFEVDDITGDIITHKIEKINKKDFTFFNGKNWIGVSLYNVFIDKDEAESFSEKIKKEIAEKSQKKIQIEQEITKPSGADLSEAIRGTLLIDKKEQSKENEKLALEEIPQIKTKDATGSEREFAINDEVYKVDDRGKILHCIIKKIFPPEKYNYDHFISDKDEYFLFENYFKNKKDAEAESERVKEERKKIPFDLKPGQIILSKSGTIREVLEVHYSDDENDGYFKFRKIKEGEESEEGPFYFPAFLSRKNNIKQIFNGQNEYNKWLNEQTPNFPPEIEALIKEQSEAEKNAITNEFGFEQNFKVGDHAFFIIERDRTISSKEIKDLDFKKEKFLDEDGNWHPLKHYFSSLENVEFYLNEIKNKNEKEKENEEPALEELETDDIEEISLEDLFSEEDLKEVTETLEEIKPDLENLDEINLEENDEEAEVKIEEIIEHLPEKKKKGIFQGLADIGFKAEQKKNAFFKKAFSKLAESVSINPNKKYSELEEKSLDFVRRRAEALNKIYSSREEESKKKAEKEGKSKLEKASGIGKIPSFVIKIGRTLYDCNYANPLRGVLATSVFFGFVSEMEKEARLKRTDLIEKTRIKDEEEAQEEALALYEKANLIAEKEGKELTADIFEKAYKENLNSDILNRIKKSENANLNLISGFAFNSIKKLLEKENKKRIEIENNNKLSPEEKENLLKNLNNKNEKIFKDLDRIVGDMGTVDTISYALRLLEKGSKIATTGLVIESGFEAGLKGVKEIWNLFSDHDKSISLDVSSSPKEKTGFWGKFKNFFMKETPVSSNKHLSSPQNITPTETPTPSIQKILEKEPSPISTETPTPTSTPTESPFPTKVETSETPTPTPTFTETPTPTESSVPSPTPTKIESKTPSPKPENLNRSIKSPFEEKNYITGVNEELKMAEPTLPKSSEEIPSPLPPPVEVSPLVEKINYQGGKSIWKEAELQLQERFKEHFSNLGSDEKDKKALKTLNIDRVKDLIVSHPEEYGLKEGIKFNRMTKEMIASVDWDKAFQNAFPENKLTENISSEAVENIVKNNESNQSLKELIRSAQKSAEEQKLEEVTTEEAPISSVINRGIENTESKESLKSIEENQPEEEIEGGHVKESPPPENLPIFDEKKLEGRKADVEDINIESERTPIEDTYNEEIIEKPSGANLEEASSVETIDADKNGVPIPEEKPEVMEIDSKEETVAKLERHFDIEDKDELIKKLGLENLEKTNPEKSGEVLKSLSDLGFDDLKEAKKAVEVYNLSNIPLENIASHPFALNENFSPEQSSALVKLLENDKDKDGLKFFEENFKNSKPTSAERFIDNKVGESLKIFFAGTKRHSNFELVINKNKFFIENIGKDYPLKDFSNFFKHPERFIISLKK